MLNLLQYSNNGDTRLGISNWTWEHMHSIMFKMEHFLHIIVMFISRNWYV